MNDILAICDRVVVLYEGTTVAELDCAHTTIEEIVNFIVTDPSAAQTRARYSDTNSPDNVS